MTACQRVAVVAAVRRLGPAGFLLENLSPVVVPNWRVMAVVSKHGRCHPANVQLMSLTGFVSFDRTYSVL